jgi:hypothetical protein
MLNRTATLADVSNVAAFVASDQARTMTAADVNISCGGASWTRCVDLRSRGFPVTSIHPVADKARLLGNPIEKLFDK